MSFRHIRFTENGARLSRRWCAATAPLVFALVLLVTRIDGTPREVVQADAGFETLPEVTRYWEATSTKEHDGWRLTFQCSSFGCTYDLTDIRPPAPVLIVPWRMPRDVVAAYFPGQEHYAYSVFWCESKLDPGAVGALGERGIAQIHPIWFRTYGVPPADLEGQVAQAAVIVADIGWSHWSCA